MGPTANPRAHIPRLQMVAVSFCFAQDRLSGYTHVTPYHFGRYRSGTMSVWITSPRL